MTDSSRIAWIEAQLADQGADVFAVFSTAWHAMGDPNGVRMLTGFKNLGDAVLILDADGGRTLIVSPAWDAERAREQAAGCRVIATDDLGEALARELAGRKRARRQIGTAGLDRMPRRIAGPIGDICAGRMRPMDDMLDRAGRCKTPAEIARAREIAAIAEKVFDRLLECAKPGMHEFELASELYRYSKEIGADDNFLLMSSSQNHKAPRPPNRRVLAEGDLILGEISPGADGQFVQICRTAVLGPISDIQRANYDILWTSMQRGMAAAKPGRAVAEVADAMNAAVAEAGYADYCGPPYFRVRGHAVGNVSSLPGDIDPNNRTLLEEGMTFVMHPNQYLPGSGYMMLGEPVVITPAGAEPLSTRLSKLVSIPV
ncbi:MAG: M24 family metallopeptidase [Rhodospirillales bacterium]|jgi:Xaa-Pro aminopeptidase|nr:hypothetical protein [Rhodospirillaceae bacterium]MDP6429470.1 M24 family metallopeptidase [Rhodospirillales bacterium]MDP6643707.1 M24 family metallopeptidase [Rhodospirillales bacterium]MDP6843383.1 M24 family metallopeptidase [Rhodospirillales bacterium]|tara:strand:- start:709 stop:1827 length:1119 start_codon:yes stop_codon:yes gene_type:complete